MFCSAAGLMFPMLNFFQMELKNKAADAALCVAAASFFLHHMQRFKQFQSFLRWSFTY
jgi:hypothetical protein